jgi:hypothetical protein
LPRPSAPPLPLVTERSGGDVGFPPKADIALERHLVPARSPYCLVGAYGAKDSSTALPSAACASSAPL